MSADTLGILRGVATLLAMLAFVGVVAWAWSRRRASTFDAAAQLPLLEDAELPSSPLAAARRESSRRESSRLET
ncbi:MAG: CcoQ/FixQ family Cbb3-type cytochrome c oxidase assembly chaperone [Steroidobacteraceae bacterium]